MVQLRIVCLCCVGTHQLLIRHTLSVFSYIITVLSIEVTYSMCLITHVHCTFIYLVYDKEAQNTTLKIQVEYTLCIIDE